MIFNKLSSYKKLIYDSFVEELGKDYRVDLFIHHYSIVKFKEILEENLGHYHYYAVMPHFSLDADKKEYLELLNRIPSDQLLLLDKDIPNFYHANMRVYQDFKQDIFHALCSARNALKKYKRIVAVFPEFSNHPTELKEGVSKFCVENRKRFSIIAGTTEKNISTETAYIVITESDLATLIKQCRNLKYRLGKDIGILSFNENVLKELLDITVVTTDFEAMGKSAAKLISNKENNHVKNPFYFISRNFL